MRRLHTIIVAVVLIAASFAQAEDIHKPMRDCTLSEEALLSLDYNLSSFNPRMTAKLISKKLAPGEGVDYQIHFASTNDQDAGFWLVSDTRHGSGAAAGDVSTCERFSLRFTLISVDGSTNAPGRLQVSSALGLTPGRVELLRPSHISLTEPRPHTTVSAIPFNGATNYVSGFTVALYSEFGGGPHDVVLRVQPADVPARRPNSPNPFGIVEFQNAPIDPALAEFLANFACKPIIVSSSVTGAITYRAPSGITATQVYRQIQDQLLTQGVTLVNMSGAYHKLVLNTETNALADVPRIEVEVRDDAVLVDGRLVSLDSLAATITRSLTPDTEVWVQDATQHSRERGDAHFVSEFARLQTELSRSLPRNRIFKAYLPQGGHCGH